MSARRHRGAGGFTLLEVMVAMAILAMSLMAAFDVVGGALRNHERTRHLELATMLARAKLAEVEARFEEDGFRDFDESDEGTFDEEGHPEVSWKVATVKPTIELGAEGVVKALIGADGGLEGLFGMAPGSLGGAGGKGGKGGASGASGAGDAGGAVSPLVAQALAVLQPQLVALGEEMKKGVREVRLTVAWKEGPSEESFTVVTHMAVLVPGSQAATAGVGGVPAGGAPPPAPNLPGFNTTQGIDPSKGFDRSRRTRSGTQEGQ